MKYISLDPRRPIELSLFLPRSCPKFKGGIKYRVPIAAFNSYPFVIRRTLFGRPDDAEEAIWSAIDEHVFWISLNGAVR